MRSLWLLPNIILPAIVSTTSVAASSVSDFVAQVESIQNTTLVQNGTVSDGNKAALSTFGQSSNVTVRLLQKIMSNTDSNDTPIALNATNTNIHFRQNGFTFIGRTIAGTDLGPGHTSVAALLGHLARQGISRLPSQIVDKAGPFYDLKTKMTLTFPSSVPITWPRAQLMSAITTLQHYFEAHDTAEQVQMSIRSASGALCTLRLISVRLDSFNFQYSESVITARSNQVSIDAYVDDDLEFMQANSVMYQLGDWIEGHPQQALIEPELTKHIVDASAELLLSVSPIGGDTADITWRQFAVGFTAMLQQMSRIVGPTRYVPMLVTFKDSRGRRQLGLWFKGTVAAFIPSPRSQ